MGKKLSKKKKRLPAVKYVNMMYNKLLAEATSFLMVSASEAVDIEVSPILSEDNQLHGEIIFFTEASKQLPIAFYYIEGQDVLGVTELSTLPAKYSGKFNRSMPELFASFNEYVRMCGDDPEISVEDMLKRHAKEVYPQLKAEVASAVTNMT